MENPILNYFKYEHLPADLQEISKPVGDLAIWASNRLPKVIGLRKLLEAKDCFVRAAL